MTISLFPTSIETIKLKVPKNILIKGLSKKIDFGGSSQIFLKKSKKQFVGQVEGEKFKIRLKTSYRNSFKPSINLTFYEFEGYTEINIEYELEVVTKFFMWFFISILTIIQISILFSKYDDFINNFNIDYIFPMLFFLFLMVFSRVGFYMSMGHSESIIKKTLLMTRNKYRKENRLN